MQIIKSLYILKICGLKIPKTVKLYGDKNAN